MDRERDPRKVFEEFQRRTQTDAQPVPASTAANDDESPPDTQVPTEDELAGAVSGGVQAGGMNTPGAGAVPESSPRPENLLPGVVSNTGNPGTEAVPGASNRSDLLDVFNQGGQGSRDDIANVKTIFRVNENENPTVVGYDWMEAATGQTADERDAEWAEEVKQWKEGNSDNVAPDEVVIEAGTTITPDDDDDPDEVVIEAGTTITPDDDDDPETSTEEIEYSGDWWGGGDPGPDTGSTAMIDRDAQQWQQIKADAEAQSTINLVPEELRTQVVRVQGDHIDLVDPDAGTAPAIEFIESPLTGTDEGNIDFGPDYLDEPPDPDEDPRLFEDRSTGGDSTAAADEYATVDGAQKSFAEQALGSDPFTPDAGDLKVATPEVDAPLAGQVDFNIAATNDDDNVPALTFGDEDSSTNQPSDVQLTVAQSQAVQASVEINQPLVGQAAHVVEPDAAIGDVKVDPESPAKLDARDAQLQPVSELGAAVDYFMETDPALNDDDDDFGDG